MRENKTRVILRLTPEKLEVVDYFKKLYREETLTATVWDVIINAYKDDKKNNS